MVCVPIVIYDILFLQIIGSVNTWGLDVFKVSDLVFEGRALTCITYRIFQVTWPTFPSLFD